MYEFCTESSDSVGSDQPVIIDLTVSEDLDECIPSSVIESNKTPPLDINGNEILISTNTKTTPAACKRARKQQETPLPISKKPNVPILPKEHTNFPILFANLTQNGYRVPPKEQIKFVTKYNRYIGYYRRYNGFRLFVQRHYARAEAHAPKNHFTKTFVQNTLLTWWSKMSATSKEQYARMAEIIYTKKLASTQTNVNDIVNGNGNNKKQQSILLMPNMGELHQGTSTSKASRVNVIKNTEANATTVIISTNNKNKKKPNNATVSTSHSTVNTQ